MTSTADESEVRDTVSTGKAQGLLMEKTSCCTKVHEKTQKDKTAHEEKMGRKTGTALQLIRKDINIAKIVEKMTS